MSKLRIPDWKMLSAHYPIMSATEVFSKIGGKVEYNSSIDVFKNACTFRISSALNGVDGPHRIPFFKDISEHNGELESQVSSGKNKYWYIIRVKMLIKHLTRTYGKPEELRSIGYKKIIQERKGIIIYDMPLGDASGHADLWDGAYVLWQEFDGANRIYFWEAGK